MIIPTLNAADTLPSALAALEGARVGEILVVDGGSDDATRAVAAAAGAKVLTAPRGRGTQLAAGAAAAAGSGCCSSMPIAAWIRSGRKRSRLS